jgi:hypothetical protein
MINEQELADAVERLREGDDNGLLVKYRDVIADMATDNKQVEIILDSVMDGSTEIAVNFIGELFEDTADMLLREAYRTKLEHEAGL